MRSESSIGTTGGLGEFGVIPPPANLQRTGGLRRALQRLWIGVQQESQFSTDASQQTLVSPSGLEVQAVESTTPSVLRRFVDRLRGREAPNAAEHPQILASRRVDPPDNVEHSPGAQRGTNIIPFAPRIPDGPEPPVVKPRWYDKIYPWLLLGKPEDVARDIVKNPGKLNHQRFVQHAIHTELQEIHLSDSNQAILRSLGNMVSFVKRHVINLALRAAIAIPEAIPFVGEGIEIASAWRAGRTHEIKFHVANAFLIDSVETAFLFGVVAPAQAIPIAGQLLALGTFVAFAGIDAWKRASARKHAREVANLLIPELSTVMSFQRNANRYDTRREVIAKAIQREYQRNPRYLTRLRQIEMELDPVNGNSERRKASYNEISTEVDALYNFREVYRNLVDPRYRITSEQQNLRKQIGEEVKLFNGKNQLKWWKKWMIKRDLRQLEYFYPKISREKKMRFDQPFYEAWRMREMWDVAALWYPEIKPTPKRRRK